MLPFLVSLSQLILLLGFGLEETKLRSLNSGARLGVWGFDCGVNSGLCKVGVVSFVGPGSVREVKVVMDWIVFCTMWLGFRQRFGRFKAMLWLLLGLDSGFTADLSFLVVCH